MHFLQMCRHIIMHHDEEFYTAVQAETLREDGCAIRI